MMSQAQQLGANAIVNKDIIGLICSFGVFGMLMSLGFLGGFRKRRHIRRLEEREQNISSLFVTQVKTFSNANLKAKPTQIFFGEAVTSTDYLKTFLSG